MNILRSNTLDKGNTPKDILMLRKFIENEGIEEYEKNTLNFLSEFLNTYTTDILQRAKQNMTYADRNKVNIDDIKLAVKSKQNSIYINRPDINTLKSLAKDVNSIPLPIIPETPHVLLPPIENNLLRNNFQVFSEDIAQYFNSTLELTSSIKQEAITMLGLKRKEADSNHIHRANKKRIRLSGDNQVAPHKHRKLSLTQPYKPKEEEEEDNDNDNDNENNNYNDNDNENDHENEGENDNENDNENEQDAIFDKDDDSGNVGDAFQNDRDDDIDFDLNQ